MTNTTNITDQTGQMGWLCYDGACAMCSALIRRSKDVLARRGIAVVPLQTRWVGRQFGLGEGEPGDEIKLLLADGRAFGGAEAVVELSKRVWWAWPVRAVAMFGVGSVMLDWGYRWVAKRRGCVSGVCAIGLNKEARKVKQRNSNAQPKKDAAIKLRDWLPLVILTVMTCVFGRVFETEIQPVFQSGLYMWLIAISVWAGCKWGTWRYALRQLKRSGVKVSVKRSAAYLLGWPGMDGVGFCDAGCVVNDAPAVRRKAVGLAAICIGIGGVVVAGVAAGWADGLSFVAQGWLVMIGLALMLHFGLFALLAQVWRLQGIDATPLMNQPVCAASVSDFWGNRWNRAFRDLTFRFIFRPIVGLGVKRKWFGAAALLIAFVASGLVHDLVISLPAGWGFGLPTLYFLIQGIALLAQRSRMGKQLSLDKGLPGRGFMLLVVIGPAYWLFHPAFIEAVVLPLVDVLKILLTGGA